MDVEHPHRDLAVVAEAVLDAGRDEHERPTTGDRRLAAEEERHLALEDVKGVILVRMRVRLEVTPRHDLDDAEREPRRVDRAREELHVADPVARPGGHDDRPPAHSSSPRSAREYRSAERRTMSFAPAGITVFHHAP